MAGTEELDRARFYKEKQEYLDARQAYEGILNAASAEVPLPEVMRSNYSVQGLGHERAATDRWVVENHPELSEAAATLVREEREYLALDEPVANHGQGNCSIVQYTAAKFYEYAALAEMLYKLATDEQFRSNVGAQLGESLKQAVESGGWFSDLAIMFGSAMSAEGRAITGVLSEEHAEFNRELDEAGRAAASRTANRIGDYFGNKWKEFKQAWEECGLANAVAKTGIDGLFLVGEIVIGGVAFRGVRFAYRLTREGFHKVDIISVQSGKTVGTASWSTNAIEGKYGKPNDNHVGVSLPDQNRTIRDGPAREPSRSQPDTQNGNGAGGATRPLRSKEELLPNRRVPTYASGQFNSWWNDLSPEELRMLWQDNQIRKQIENQVRAPGGLHEWLMTGMGPKLKELGFTMDEIKVMTTPTKEASGPIPGTSGERWRHTTDEGKTGTGSGRMHDALEREIEQATDRADLLKRLETFSHEWLDNGPDSFPAPLRDLIINSQ